MPIRKPESRSLRRVPAVRRALGRVVGCVLLAALAGCGSSHHATHTSSTKTTTTATARQQPTASKPLVTVPETVDDGTRAEHLRIGVYDLRRVGPYVVLDLGITCLENTSSGCDGELDFAAPSHSGAAVYGNANKPSGVVLVDPAGHKEYLPVRDSQNRPFTSLLPPSIDDAYTHLAWVVFLAPPASVGALDVALPNGGPQIPSVPISSSSNGPSAGGNVVAAQPAPFAASLGSTDTTGLTLPVENLVETVGNPNGSDSESATQDTVTLRSDVLFHFDKSNLTSTAHAILAQLAPEVKARAVGPVTVTGYTDSIGTDQVNIPLSEARAGSVVAALQPLTPGVTYHSAGMGPADPVAPNTKPDGSDNPAGRALNRRVTIVFPVKAPSRPTPPPAAASTATSQTAQTSTMSFAVSAPSFTDHYQATVDDAFREGDLLVVRMTVACAGVSGQAGGNTCNGETDLAGTATVPPQLQSEGSAAYDSISGFYLRDPASGTEYIPLYDTAARPLTAGVDVYMGVGQSYPVWAYFPAPPSSASSVTVVAPGGSTSAAGVPISASPPAQP